MVSLSSVKAFINTPQFKEECIAFSKQIYHHDDSSVLPASSKHSNLSSLCNNTSIFSVKSSVSFTAPLYKVILKYKAMFYYAGISWSPSKLICHTSKDVFKGA